MLKLLRARFISGHLALGLNQFAYHGTVINEELRSAIRVMQHDVIRVDAQLLVDRCEDVLQMNRTILSDFTKAVR